jgi:hypothetical protein
MTVNYISTPIVTLGETYALKDADLLHPFARPVATHLGLT